MSTTKDEQAKYGERPKEREPMLTHKDAIEYIEPMYADSLSYEEQLELAAFNKARDHYESLITTGKLRVVGECVVRTSDGDNWPLMQVLGCNGKGPVTDEVWCPYCGNKIKR